MCRHAKHIKHVAACATVNVTCAPIRVFTSAFMRDDGGG